MRCPYPRLLRLWLSFLLISLTPAVASASVSVVKPDRFDPLQMTCESPVPLVHDCSVRKGPTRPIALEQFRMNVAGASDGRTVLISQVRLGPDHNGGEFAGSNDRRAEAIAAIRAMRRLSSQQGICLERWETISHGRQVRGYLLTFSDDVYPLLRENTVLESEHWLPRRLTRR